ncbi:MAG: dTMP kinase [Candidatus Aminicenantes bacterium]|nr:dTMP kinase [Candidatus Aminicenantes bacterium]
MSRKQRKLSRGFLVVLEGIDGCGKSTQAKRLVRALRHKGFDTVLFKEPTQGRWGRQIKEKAGHPNGLTPKQEFELFQKDRKQNVELNLKPALEKKKIVVLDRYYFSTIAYQGAKGIDIHKIKRQNSEIAVSPDLVFILDVDARTGLDRIKDRQQKDRLFEKEDYLQEVRKRFKSFAGENIVHLDGNASRDDIFLKIKDAVMNRINGFII